MSGRRPTPEELAPGAALYAVRSLDGIERVLILSVTIAADGSAVPTYYPGWGPERLETMRLLLPVDARPPRFVTSLANGAEVLPGVWCHFGQSSRVFTTMDPREAGIDIGRG